MVQKSKPLCMHSTIHSIIKVVFEDWNIENQDIENENIED